MDNHWLSAFWSDWLNVVSLILTLLGFGISIYMILQARSAAQAAEKAAEAVLRDSQRDFGWYTAAIANRFVSEAELHVRAAEWILAATRMNDLADQFAQLSQMSPGSNELQSLVNELREWAHTLKRISTEKSKFADRKWAAFLLKLKSMIDGRFGPFRENKSRSNP